MSRRNKPELLDELARARDLDDELRGLTAERDQLRRSVNELSKQVGLFRRDGKADEAEAAMADSRNLGQREAELAQQASGLEAELRDVLLRIPNLPHPEAPDGKSEADNPVVKGPIGLRDDYPEHQRVPHW